MPALPVATVGVVGVVLTAFDVFPRGVYNFEPFFVVLFQWLTAVCIAMSGVLCWRGNWRVMAIVMITACLMFAMAFLFDAYWQPFWKTNWFG